MCARISRAPVRGSRETLARRIDVHVDGEPGGPFTTDELSALWRTGDIPADALCWHRALRGWVSVRESRAPAGTPITAEDAIVLTTTPTVARREIEAELEIITAECVIGMNTWKDLLARLTDTFGGRSETTQNALRRARKTPPGPSARLAEDHRARRRGGPMADGQPRLLLGKQRPFVAEALPARVVATHIECRRR